MNTQATTKVTVELHLTPNQMLHVFVQWLDLNMKTDLSTITKKTYRLAIRDLLAARGWRAVTANISSDLELKKLDIKAQLKGIVQF